MWKNLLWILCVGLVSCTDPWEKNQLSSDMGPFLSAMKDSKIAWQAWSRKAFLEAKERQKLIFVALGSASCSNCRERISELSRSRRTARLLKRYYISILMDSNQSPELSEILSELTVSIADSVGWPLYLILTPDGKPLWASHTLKEKLVPERLYFVSKRWRKDRVLLKAQAERWSHPLWERSYGSVQRPDTFDEIYLREVRAKLDFQFGGIDKVPKFYYTPIFRGVLEHLKSHSKSSLNHEFIKYLEGILHGTVYDPISFGFFDFSRDGQWTSPQFVKSFLIQIQLAELFLESFAWSKEEKYKKMAKETLDFIYDDFSIHKASIFPTAIEGLCYELPGDCYTVKVKHLQEFLSAEELELLRNYFSLDLFNEEGPQLLKLRRQFDIDQAKTQSGEVLEKIRQSRKREAPQPLKDDQEQLSLIGYWISVMVKASRILKSPVWLKRAESLYLKKRNQYYRRGDWLRIYWQEKAFRAAEMKDLTRLLEASLKLFRTTQKKNYLLDAENLYQAIKENFYDSKENQFCPLQSQFNIWPSCPLNWRDISDWSALTVLVSSLVDLVQLSTNPLYQKDLEQLLEKVPLDLYMDPLKYQGLLQLMSSGKALLEKQPSQ